MNEIINQVKEYLAPWPVLWDILVLIVIFLLAFIVHLFTRRVFFHYIKVLISRTKTQIDDIFLTEKLLDKIALIIPIIIVHEFAYLMPNIEALVNRLSGAIIAVLILIAGNALLTSLTIFLERMDRFKERPIKGYIQVIKIIFVLYGIIIIMGLLTGESPWTLLGGISALTAVLLLIFRDTILSFVASIQITSYDLIKVGDWVEISKYGADGDVIDISLNVIKIQNFDKTITVIPTYKIVEDSFKNWRGMTLSGGRRIKRAIYLDMGSIRFLEDDDITKLEKIHLLKGYLEGKKEELAKYNEDKKIDTSSLVNGRRMTNIGTFRAYLKAYLKQREDINPGMTFLIRQLPAGEKGLPLEIYVFTGTTEWVRYEEIQADIFDHLFAVLPEFDLRVFQFPTGSDLKNLTPRTKAEYKLL